MQRLIYVLAFFPIIVSNVHSQDVSVKYGDELDIDFRGINIIGCHSMNKDGYLLAVGEFTGMKAAEMTLHHFDSALKLESSKTYQAEKERSETLALALSAGRLAWFTTQKVNGEDSLACFMATGKVGGEFGKHEQILKIYTVNTHSFFTDVQYMTSPDSSKHIIHAIYDREGTDAKPFVSLAVVDNEFNMLWSKHFELEYIARRFTVLSWAALPNGDVCMLAKVYGNDKFKEAIKQKSGFVPDTKYVLYQFSKNSEKPSVHELKLENLFVNGPAVFTTRQNEVLCSGFYAKSQNGYSVGMFYLKIDGTNGNVLIDKKHDFSKEDLIHFGKKYIEKGKDERWGTSENFHFKQLYSSENGASILIAEDEFEAPRMRFLTSSEILHYGKYMGDAEVPGNPKRLEYYSKNAVAIFNINKKGDIQAIRLIRKAQTMYSEDFLGYISFIKGEAQYFFYNENEDNLDKGIDEKFKQIPGLNKNNVPEMVILYPNGEIKRQHLFNEDKEISIILPKYSAKVDEKKLLFFSMRVDRASGYKYRIGLATFND